MKCIDWPPQTNLSHLGHRNNFFIDMPLLPLYKYFLLFFAVFQNFVTVGLHADLVIGLLYFALACLQNLLHFCIWLLHSSTDRTT